MDNNTRAFFALLRAGLWEQDVRLSDYAPFDYKEVYRIAEEQSVIGIIAAGLNHVHDIRPPKEVSLSFVMAAISFEKRNTAMNNFIGGLFKKLQENGINAVLIKGQGIAQCYENPLWRACGDVDLLLDEDNYEKAKRLLVPLASFVEAEALSIKHLCMTINSWVVELHGTFHSGTLLKMDKMIDIIQDDVLKNGNIRIWKNGIVDVPLPAATEDVSIVFSHILKHYFHGGVGLRQVCDWCRLLWTNKDSIKADKLNDSIRKMGICTEWKSFASLVVHYLGMPRDAMFIFEEDSKWQKKSRRILSFILKTGNFGHNRDLSYYHNKSFFVRKVISSWRHTKDGINHFREFPRDATEAWLRLTVGGVISVLKF